MASCFVKKENNIWLLDSKPGVEYFTRIDISNGESICEYVFPESAINKMLFSDMVLIDDKIIFVPLEAENIYIWSIENKVMQVKNFSPHIIDRFGASRTKFTNAVVMDNYVYLIPHKYAFMIKLDVISLDIEYIDCFNEKVLSEHVGEGGLFERGAGYDGGLYLLCNGSNNICMYNPKENNYKLVPVGENDIRFSDVYYDGQELWLTDNNDRVLKLNNSTGKLQCLLDYGKEGIEKNNDNPVWNKKIVAFNNAIWIFSYAFPIIRIDVDSLKYMVVSPEKKASMLPTGLNHVYVARYGEKIYALKQYKNVIEEFADNPVEKRSIYSISIGEDKVLKSFIDMVVKE